MNWFFQNDIEFQPISFNNMINLLAYKNTVLRYQEFSVSVVLSFIAFQLDIASIGKKKWI